MRIKSHKYKNVLIKIRIVLLSFREFHSEPINISSASVFHFSEGNLISVIARILGLVNNVCD